ncbi:MAG TPA: hypothetical protein VF482_17495 [Trebonia sp.]
MSAGFTMGLAGCGPISLASNAGQLQGGHGDGSGGQHTNSRTTNSSGTQYSFRTLDNPADPTFNQLLGINNRSVIAGYFGSGAAGHPNQGYVLDRTPAGFAITNENFPNSVQTQVTGLNDRGVTVGFWSDMNTANMNDNFGFYAWHGRFHSVNFPTGTPANPPVDQLLGVNDAGTAVGFFTNSAGVNRGYEYNIPTGHFSRVLPPDASGTNLGSSLTAAGINNHGDVAGFYNQTANQVDAFLKLRSGKFITLAYPSQPGQPQVTMTQAFGVNDSREVVGAYTTGTGNTAQTHGFTWTRERGFRTVDDPQGTGTTTINGVNDQGDLVGFYVDGAGNTNGFAAVPADQNPLPGLIGAASPTPSTSPSSSSTPSTSPTSTMSPTPSTSPTSTMSPAPSTSPTGGTTPSQSPSPNPLQPTHF